MALSAIIFDVDGTLVDTNQMHILAWQRALQRHGYKFNLDRIFVEVGKGGDTLVPDLLGEQADKQDGDALRKAQPQEFRKIAEQSGIRVFPDAKELIQAAQQRGLKTVLATSSGKSQLAVIEQFSNVRWSEIVDAVVNADDTQTSKPAPDLVTAAVKKFDLSPAECVMVGDTRYDAISAKHAGVVCFGLTCGGNPEEWLMNDGCRRVWKDPAALLAGLSEAMLLASPGIAVPTTSFLETLMREALAHAEVAMTSGEAPIAAVIARGDGSIVARGFNELNRTQNKTAHAEMVTFANAAKNAPTDATDLILVSTLEPCVMCTGAAMEAAVDTIVYALAAPADAGTGRVNPPRSPDVKMPRIVPNVLASESLKLFKRWLAEFNPPAEQRAYVEQLLRLHETD